MDDFLSGTLFDRGTRLLVLSQQIILAAESLFHLHPLEARRWFCMAMALSLDGAGTDRGAVVCAKENRARSVGGAALLRRHNFSRAGLHERVWDALFICLGSLGLFAELEHDCAGRRSDRAMG